MKKISMLVFFLLVFVGCSDSDESEENSNESEQKKVKVNHEIDCLEKHLGWIDNPPLNKVKFLATLEMGYEVCAITPDGTEQFILKVLGKHPQFWKIIFENKE